MDSKLILTTQLGQGHNVLRNQNILHTVKQGEADLLQTVKQGEAAFFPKPSKLSDYNSLLLHIFKSGRNGVPVSW